ncbi:hypothetical protein CVCC1112_2924 [Paenarthrobacter nicotinovorans]|uniref:ABC transporter substrate-binding protein n=1 Tax=Paenarthrobacter nicotinovorans TaxID=29320 RepID=UPI0007CD3A98|nr:ABC transporter substrate-binding protein [Paenarthrobacter nicotinovorans]GAT88265.1 hypothetical protein CVCC1112_2924 [Paenarthrobacter nicotinovorans]
MSQPKIRRSGGAIAAVALLATLSLSACNAATSNSEAQPRDIAKVTWALSGDFDSLDPAKCFDFNCLVLEPSITESLFRLDATGAPKPNLATSYEYVSPTQLVINVREGVTFQDGTPMTVEDVVYSLNRHLDSAVGSYVGYMFDSVKSIASSGKSQITVTLSKPDSRLVPALATTAGAVISKTFVEAHGDKVGSPSVGTLGTGPYKFESWDKGEKTTLSRYDGYWNKDRARAVKTFVARVVPEESTIVSGLRSNDIDGAFESALSGRALQTLSKATGLTSDTTNGAGLRLLAFNTQKAPFDDPRVRQALVLALDRGAMLSSIGGGNGEVVASLSPKALYTGDTAKFNDALSTYPSTAPDVDKAKQLVKEAGATGKTAELWSTASQGAQALAIQEAAAKIGITINIRETPVTDLNAAQRNTGKGHPYGLTLSYAVADLLEPYGMLGFAYTSNAPFNATGYSDPAYDALVTKAVAEPDPATRADLFITAERELFKAQPVAPLFAPAATMVHNAGIGGYEMRALWSWDSFIADLRSTKK